MLTVAIIGYGEVGSIFARDLAARGAGPVRVYDVAATARERAGRAGVFVAESAREAPEGAEVVFVAVTAGSVLAAMHSLEGGLQHAPLVVDVNSVSPATKQEAERLVTGFGGRYVEAAVMTSVPPMGLASPMLLGGAHAGAFMTLMAPYAMVLTAYADRVGPASSVKMCRSVMIKGLEALTTECLLAARHYGVEEDVLRSLSDTLPHEDWHALARYVMSRALIHGRRRSEEMREVARTVEDAGLEPLLSRSIADRQQWAAELGQELTAQERAETALPRLLDAMTGALDRRERQGKLAPG